jgi:hypothetical protein
MLDLDLFKAVVSLGGALLLDGAILVGMALYFRRRRSR